MATQDRYLYEILRDKTFNSDIYLVHYRPGRLRRPPWGRTPCDCFVILGDREIDADTARCLARELAELNNDWVYVYGTQSEMVHDLIDQASVDIGRQAQVGDGFPMTGWYSHILDPDEIADSIPGAQPVTLVVLVNQDEEVLQSLKRRIVANMERASEER